MSCLKLFYIIHRQKWGSKWDGFKRLNTYVYIRLEPLFCFNNNIMRNIKNLPFCWQEKKALSLIREHFKKSKLPLAISLYCTLTEQASYFWKDTFNIFWIKLIEQSWIWYKSFREIMNKFIDLKIIIFKKWKIYKIPLTQEFIYWESEITLLQILLVQTCTEPCTTSCTHSGQSYKELKEEPKEELKENKKLKKNNNYLVDINKIFNYWQILKEKDKLWKWNRKLDKNITSILTKIVNIYSKEDIEIWIKNYLIEIENRKKWVEYSKNRFSLQEFYVQKEKRAVEERRFQALCSCCKKRSKEVKACRWKDLSN